MNGGSIEDAQARDHLEMVDRILAESSQRLCYGAEFFVVWGLYSATATVLWQLVGNGILPRAALWATAAALLAAIAFSIVRGRAKERGRLRRSIVQREFFNVMWLTIAVAFVANAGAFNIFSGWAAAAIWSLAEAIVLFFIGMHGNRRALIAGIVILVSVVVANFIGPALAGYVLAAGMLAGYAGFGTAELLLPD